MNFILERTVFISKIAIYQETLYVMK